MGLLGSIFGLFMSRDSVEEASSEADSPFMAAVGKEPTFSEGLATG